MKSFLCDFKLVSMLFGKPDAFLLKKNQFLVVVKTTSHSAIITRNEFLDNMETQLVAQSQCQYTNRNKI